ncbi:MAG: nuclear transport factor 2 family protein [Elusimicrobia bacterium]|nr:nuclear transport factor 2 family protein [Elusimicrobiota bacterium]
MIGGTPRRAVIELFDALDRRDLNRFLSAFCPRATIVHCDGQTTSAARFVRDLRRSPHPAPLRRRLRGFFGAVAGDWAWLRYHNVPTFASPTHALHFVETAVLRRRDRRWRFQAIHYSHLDLRDDRA